MQRYFTLRPSRLLFLILLFLGTATLYTLWTLPLPIPFALALSVVAAGWVIYWLTFTAILRSRSSCVAFRLEDDGIVLVLRNGDHVSGCLAADTLITPYLLVLNVALRESNKSRSVLILPDSMGAESFRRLRVGLRWSGNTAQASI